ncbi:MAG: ABC transporter permease [Desulfotalea sp.]
MNILTIPLRNMRRKPSKTLLLLLVFTLGVISIIALYKASLVVGESLERKLTSFGANIIVSPQTQTLKVSYGGFNMGDMLIDINQLGEQDTVQAIKSIGYQDRISIIAPKLVSMAKVDDTPVAVIGVRWQEELALKSYWVVSGSYPESEKHIVLGATAAKTFGLQPGDSIQLYEQNFTVTGVLSETGGDDDTVVFMQISTLQGLLNTPDVVSFVEVAALCSGCPIDDIVSQIREGLPQAEVKALQNVVNQRMASIHFVQKLALVVSVIILITATAMVGLSMLSAVNERKKDIGILRSLGFSKGQVFSIFCCEAGLIGVVAGAIGYVLGFIASSKILIWLSLAEGISPTFSFWQLLLTSFLFGIITLLSALYPAWKGASIEPSSALVAL